MTGESAEMGEEPLSGNTCRVLYYTRTSSLTDAPADIGAASAHPADRELWSRLKNCANANRCGWGDGPMYASDSCIQRFCKKQSDQCLYGDYHNVPGTPQTAPPLNQVFTCTAKGYFHATVKGEYGYYNMTGTGKNQDRSTAARLALDACNKGMNDALATYTPSQLSLGCRHLYCL